MTKILSVFAIYFGFLQFLNAQTQCLDTGIDSAIYTMTFQSVWNASDHSSIPSSAHWSDLVSIMHNQPNQFLELGALASLGVKNVAELGDNLEITSEIQEEIDNENAVNLSIFGFEPNNATSSLTFQVSVCDSHPYITLLSMIAPSPDWFIAVNSLRFTTDVPVDGLGFWKQDFEVDVYAYDAGTDGGTDYTSPDNPITPVGISMISGFPFNGIKVGTLSVVLEVVLLSNENFGPLEKVKLYPNPSKGLIHLDNAENIAQISVYNTLGHRVLTIPYHNSEHINLSFPKLQSGIYLIKLTDSQNNHLTKKIVLD